MTCDRCDREILQICARNRLNPVDLRDTFDDVNRFLEGDPRLPEAPCGTQNESCVRFQALGGAALLIINEKQAE